MKRFRFKLQTLLDHRRSKEELLQAELGRIRHEEAVELARLEGLQARLRGAMSELECLKVSNISALQRLDEYAKAVRDDIKVQYLTIEAVRERLEAKRVEVVEAMKARKVIEALHDKQERDYLAEHARAEQSSLDDMASLRHVRTK